MKKIFVTLLTALCFFTAQANNEFIAEAKLCEKHETFYTGTKYEVPVSKMHEINICPVRLRVRNKSSEIWHLAHHSMEVVLRHNAYFPFAKKWNLLAIGSLLLSFGLGAYDVSSYEYWLNQNSGGLKKKIWQFGMSDFKREKVAEFFKKNPHNQYAEVGSILGIISFCWGLKIANNIKATCDKWLAKNARDPLKMCKIMPGEEKEFYLLFDKQSLKNKEIKLVFEALGGGKGRKDVLVNWK